MIRLISLNLKYSTVINAFYNHIIMKKQIKQPINQLINIKLKNEINSYECMNMSMSNIYIERSMTLK